MEGNRAVTNLQTVLSSAMDEISGQLGGQLSPQIKALTDNLAEWFKNGGISKIVSFMKNELYPGVLTFGNGVVFVGKIIYAAAKKLSWLLPDDQDNKKRILQSVATGTPVKIAAIQAESEGLGEWFSQNVNQPGRVEMLKKQWQSAEDKAGWLATANPFTNGEFQENTSQHLLDSVDGKPSEGPFSFDWASEMSKNRREVSQSSVPTFPENERAKEDVPPRRDSELPDMDAWPTLMQQIDRVDIERKPTSITDSRRQELKVEINVSSEQEGLR